MAFGIVVFTRNDLCSRCSSRDSVDAGGVCDPQRFYPSVGRDLHLFDVL
jgi:hypothetical protein